jgi:PAS domain S-box-containing protein
MKSYIKTQKPIPKFQVIRPNMVIFLTVFLGVLLFISAIIDIQSTRKELVQTLDEQGRAIISSVQKGMVNATLSFALVEELLAEKMLSNARLIEEMDYRNVLTPELFAKISKENDLFRANIFNQDGERIMSNVKHAGRGGRGGGQRFLLKSILEEGNDELILGFRQGRFGSGNRFAVAKRRRKGGAIVLNIDAEDMLEFRKRIGTGKLLREIGEADGLVYVVLQDTLQVLLASGGVHQMSSIPSDAFLMKAMQNNESHSRMLTVDDDRVFEIVQPVYIEDEFQGLLRVGLSTLHLQQAVASSKRRAILTSLLLLIVGVVVGNGVIGAQNYRSLRKAYDQIETYTGSILTNMTDAVLAINREGKITLFNREAERLFGIGVDEALNKPCEEISPDLCPILNKTIQQETILQNHELSLTIEKKQYIVWLSVAFLKEQDTAFAVIKDITRQKKLEANLKRIDQLTAMGQLASGVAHEIRNPLNSISMIAQRLHREFEPRTDENEYEKLANTMVNESRRINSIIQQFLQFARPSKLQLEKNNICEIIDEITTLIKTEAREKELNIQTRCDHVPEIMMDRGKFQQVLLNLVRNSMDACSRGGEIKINVEQEDNELIVSISDTGKGIPKDQLSKIFNLYFTTKENGTGLGLSIVQQIISQHNGTIEVRSQAGKGTTFIIHLQIRES